MITDWMGNELGCIVVTGDSSKNIWVLLILLWGKRISFLIEEQCQKLFVYHHKYIFVVNSVIPENCRKANKYWTRILIDVGWFWFSAALHNYRNKVSFVGVTNLLQSHNKQVFLALGIYTLLSHCFVFKIFLARLRSRKSLISSDCHIWLCKRKNLPLPAFIRQTYIYHCTE